MSILWKSRVLTFYAAITVIMLLFFIFVFIPVQLARVSYNTKYFLAVIFSRIFIYGMYWICGIKFKVQGLDKLPQKSVPFLALSNHQSDWENFFMQLIIPKHSWVIKKELFNIPLFGKCLKAADPIAVDRGSKTSVMQILLEGKKKIESGISIVMFPESTRIPVGRDVKFKPSAAKLALENKVPIVIMAHNSGLIWPKGFWFLRPGTIKFNIIEQISPVKAAQMDARELTEYIQQKITNEKHRLIGIGV